jgi:hypothetical protein
MARLIQYEDLALAIEPGRGERYQVRTLVSPYGAAAAPFILPFGRKELEEMIQSVGAGVLRCRAAASSRPARDLVRPETTEETAFSFHEIGARLFRALFHEAVQETYWWSRGRTESHLDRGLRLRLVLPTDTPASALLEALPWELLYCEQTGDFLARSVLTPVVRQLPLSRVASSPFSNTVPAGLRILIAVANPSGTTPLGVADERARILAAWCRQRGAEVKVLHPATLAGLTEALRSEHFEVLHFIAHGSFDAGAGVGSLLLETDRGGVEAVPGSLLAATLHASRELRLVFLNSCRTAELGHRPGQDPLLGTAAALVRHGVPAVIAMQFPISDRAATLFGEAVYRSLARGSSLEAAVGDGRLALHQADTESWEWITPALFTALSDASVFRPLCSAPLDIARAVGLLGAQSYERARQVVDSCFEEGLDSADLHYYKALALLGDRRPRSLDVEELRPVEASAIRVLLLADRAAHHLCLLAFLQKDFYLENHLVPPQPGYEELLEQAAALPLDEAKLQELVDLVPGIKAFADHVAERARSGSR